MGNLRFKIPIISISSFILMVFGLATTLCFAFLGYYALSTIYKDKVRDNAAILHLNSEHFAKNFTEKMLSLKDSCKNCSIYKPTGKSSYQIVKGSHQRKIKPADFGLYRWPGKQGIFLGQIDAKTYALFHLPDAGRNDEKSTTYYLYITPIDITNSLSKRFPDGEATRVYLMSDSGSTFFNSHVDAEDTLPLQKRDLVQSFINSKVNSGNVEITDDDFNTIYGSFFVLKNTNLVLFFEMEKNIVLSSIKMMGLRYGIAATSIVIVFLLLLHVLLSPARAALKTFFSNMGRMSMGNFTLAGTRSWFRETNNLSLAILELGSSMDRWVKSIPMPSENPNQEKQISSISDLSAVIGFSSNVPSQHSYELNKCNISLCHRPSENFNGDWIAYRISGDDKISICIADVAGTGDRARKSIEILRSAYEKQLTNSAKEISFNSMAHTVNDKIMNMQGHSMMISLLGISIDLISRKVQLFNCGYSFPIAIDVTEGQIIPTNMPSNPLGLMDELYVAKRSIQVSQRLRMLIYSKGTINHPDSGNTKNLTRRRLVSELKNKQIMLSASDLESFHQKILGTCQSTESNEKLPQKDDICLISLDMF